MPEIETLWYFDWRDYGRRLRDKRRKMGFEGAPSFAEHMTEKCPSVLFTRGIIYKIEQGRMIPRADQYLALYAITGVQVKAEGTLTKESMLERLR